MTLDKIDFSNGIWRGLLKTGQAQEKPELQVTLNGAELDPCVVTAGSTDSEWIVEIAVPAHAIGDGVFTFVVLSSSAEHPIATFCLSGGRSMEYDMQAEVALLREEIEILKRAFRRHIHNTR